MKMNEKILQCRKRMGLSQEALAQQLNTSRQAVSRWELGDAQPELNNIIALAKLFGVTTDWLLMDDDSSLDAPQLREEAPPAGEKSYAEGASFTWVEQLPGVIGRLFKRYGWMLGVYAAVLGLLFALIGGAAVSISTSMMNYSESMFDDMHTGFDWAVGGTTLYDESGEVITNPEIYEAFGFSMPSNTHEQGFPNPVAALGRLVIGFGVLMIIGGTAIAILLKRRAAQTGDGA